MRRIGVAMRELDHIIQSPTVHKGVVNFLLGNYCAHRHGAIGHLLGNINDIRHHAKFSSSRSSTNPTKRSDNLIKDEQYIMLITDLTQPLQIADRRRYHTR